LKHLKHRQFEMFLVHKKRLGKSKKCYLSAKVRTFVDILLNYLLSYCLMSLSGRKYLAFRRRL
jgi:hypothetical protein